MNDNKAERLAQEHWDWLNSVLVRCEIQGSVLALCRVLYISAFKHGYKHALRQCNDKGQFVSGGGK